MIIEIQKAPIREVQIEKAISGELFVLLDNRIRKFESEEQYASYLREKEIEQAQERVLDTMFYFDFNKTRYGYPIRNKKQLIECLNREIKDIDIRLNILEKFARFYIETIKKGGN
jgi:hypothetical protein